VQEDIFTEIEIIPLRRWRVGYVVKEVTRLFVVMFLKLLIKVKSLPRNAQHRSWVVYLLHMQRTIHVNLHGMRWTVILTISNEFRCRMGCIRGDALSYLDPETRCTD
jgi:hypothetical protein